MTAILATLFVTSFLDSLNPTAIAQTLLFLGSEKRKSKILVFILAMFLTNSALGLSVYYGALSPLMLGYDFLKENHPTLVFALSLALGILAILLGILFGILKHHRLRKEGKKVDEKKPSEAKNLSFLSMFLMGMLFTAVELTTALPYFAFLMGLAPNAFPFYVILLLIFLYSFIYCLPLLLVFFLYVAMRNSTAVLTSEKLVSHVSPYVLPFAFVLVGLMFLFSLF